MSYTHFTYSDLKVSAPSMRSTGSVEVSFELTNSGDRAGSEVAQFYTHQQHSVAVQPIKSLRAFERVTLGPGERKHVQFTLHAADLAYYNVSQHRFTVEPSTFDLLVGSSSEDIRLRGRVASVASPGTARDR